MDTEYSVAPRLHLENGSRMQNRSSELPVNNEMVPGHVLVSSKVNEKSCFPSLVPKTFWVLGYYCPGYSLVRY